MTFGCLVVGVAVADAVTPSAGTAPPPAVITLTPTNAVSSADADAVEAEFKELLKKDDAAHEAAQAIVDQAASATDPLTAPLPLTTRARIDEKIRPVRDAYEDFLRRHPGHARSRMAFASFLSDTGNEVEAIEHYEKAKGINPKDPAAWNNLANLYAHVGPVEKAFPHYEEAIRLKPDEALYLHNFGTLLFLYRKEAARFYKVEEAAIFNRGIELYRKAIALDPKDFSLASDVAQTYYGIPRSTGISAEASRAEEGRLVTTALQSWTNAFQLAPGDTEREGIRIHLARWNIRALRFDDARAQLAAITNATYLAVKKSLEKDLATRQSEAVSPR